MPYIVLAIGALTALFAFYRFFISATPQEIRRVILYFLCMTYMLVLLYLAMSERIFIALGLLILAIPFVISYFRNKEKRKKP